MTTGTKQNSIIPGAHVPDGGWGWMVVLASFMIHFIMDGITYSMGDVFLQPMKEKLNTDRGPVSFIFGLLPAITLSAGPIATIFTNRYGCRQVTIVGSILAALGFLVSSIVANLWIYYFAIGILGGIGFGLIYLPAIVSVGFYFEAKRSFAMGIAVSGSGLGTLAFPLLMEYIIHKPFWFDYDGALLLEAAVIFVCVLFGIIMIPLPQEPSEIRRLEKEARRKAKKEVHLKSSMDEEQNDRLLSSNKKNIELEHIDNKTRQSSAVVPRQDEEEETPKIDEIDIDEDQNNETSIVLSRKDAIYQGSLHNIPLYNENPDEYHRRIVEISDIHQNQEQISTKNGKTSFLSELAKQIDLKLLKDPTFALFAASNFLTSLGFNVPYNFARDLATDAQVEPELRINVIMSIGIANCIGRVVIGYLADRSKINRLYLYNITLIIAGIATMLAPLSNSWVLTHMTYGAFFGFFSGGYVGLTSIIVVDLVGVDKLSDAFGTLLLFQGVAVAIGTPIVGVMRDLLANFERPYLWPYLIFGGSILISGLMLFAIPTIKKYQERHRPVNEDRRSMGVLSYSREHIPSDDKENLSIKDS